MKKRCLSKNKWIGLLAVLVVVGGCIFGASRLHRSISVQKTTVAMGSVVTQTIYAAARDHAEQAAADAATELAGLESRISCKLNSSEIAALNQSAQTCSAVDVSADTAKILSQCLQVQQVSGGRYNICTRPLTVLWDFDAEMFSVPTVAVRTNAAALVQKSVCTLTGNRAVLVPAGAGIDLGSAGKGAACDAAVAVYADSGCTAAIIAVGGSIGIYGTKPDGSAWSIGVRDPAGTQTESIGTLSLYTGFVSTSGTYEKTRESGGVVYHHLLDPATGLPAETDLISATVVCSSGTLSDALATACVVLGRTDGTALLKQFGAEYLLVGTDGLLTVSNGLFESFTLTSPAYALR